MSEDRKPRRDGVANRTRIINAAAKAFRDDGLTIDMRTIAEAAGVGVGTLYRHFPTREDLLRTVLDTDLAEFSAVGLPAHLAAIEGLRTFALDALHALHANRALADLLAGSAPSEAELARCLTHLTEIGEQALTRSAVDHTLAPDTTPEDIAFLLLSLIRVAPFVGHADPDELSRRIEVTLRGISSSPRDVQPRRS